MGRERIILLFSVMYCGVALGQTMTEDTKLTASDGAALNFFGEAVATTGDTLVVGAKSSDFFCNDCGAAYVYELNGGLWIEQARISGSDIAPSGNAFGSTIAMSGDTIVVGAPSDDCAAGINCGSVYVFVKPPGGWEDMFEVAKLSASDATQNAQFGLYGLAIDGDTVIVGSPASNSGKGMVYVFEKPVSGWVTMTETARLTTSGAFAGAAGTYTSISGNTIVAGAPNEDSNRGTVFLYAKPPGDWIDATQTGKLFASDHAPNDRLGQPVSVFENTVVAGVSGKNELYVYERPSGGWAAVNIETAVLSISDGGLFTNSIANTTDYVLVGASGNGCVAGSLCGAAYLWTKFGYEWNDSPHSTKYVASDAAAGDRLGSAVALKECTVVIGAHWDDNVGGSDAGAAYVSHVSSGCDWGNRSGAMELRPVFATGSYAIDGNDIYARRSSTVTLDVMISDWGNKKLRVAQARMNSATYTSGTTGSLSPLVVPNVSAGAFIDLGREDYLHSDWASTIVVDTSTLNYRFASGADDPDGPLGVATSKYFGTLKLVVSNDANGEFVVGFDENPNSTFVLDENSFQWTIESFVPATIRILTRLYVDDTAIGANNGSNWANAFLHLQDALAAAQPGDEIWVAQGIYKPDRGGGQTLGNRTATFQLQNGVSIYGGFNGTETLLSQRNPTANATVLSGDLLGDDEGVACVQNSPDCDAFGGMCLGGFCSVKNNSGENSYHVTTGSGTDASALLDGFVIVGGRADGPFPEGGGGMANVAGSPTVARCTFAGNFGNYGGGMFNVNGSPTVTNSTFRRNSALFVGGGMESESFSTPTLTNCLFSGNSAAIGGGLGTSQSNTLMTNCTFSGNTAASSGGGVYNADSNAVLINSILWGNTDSGGMDESAQIHSASGTPTVDYSIVQGGWTGAGGNNLSADPLFRDTDGADNIEGTSDDDLRLRAGSPAIDSGDTTAVPVDIFDLNDNGNILELIPLDLAGSGRCVDDPATLDSNGVVEPGYAVVDRGVYEYFTDCNGNDIVDANDIGSFVSEDCDSAGWPGNGIPDECDIATCNADPACDDCNLNGVPDGCDIGSGFSLDTDPADGIPDECAAFTQGCADPGQEQYWTCGDNWPLGGEYPDDADSAAGVFVTLSDGVVALLNETVVIPALRVEEGATLLLTQSGEEGDLQFSPPAVLEVYGTILVSGSHSIGEGINPDVIIGPGGVYEAAGESVAGVTTASLYSADLSVIGSDCFIPPCPHGGEINLSESMSVTTTGDLTIDGSLANGECSTDLNDGSVALSFHTPPSVRVVGADTRITVGSNVVLSGAAGFMVESLQPVAVAGNWDNQSVRPDCFDAAAGAVRLEGTEPQMFEVAATDTGGLGATSIDFRIGDLEIAAGADVTIRDQFDNDLQPQASCGEAQYLGALVLEAGASLTVQNCRVYFDSLIQDPSSQITITGCAEVRAALDPGPLQADPSGLSKSRALSFVPPGNAVAGGGGSGALRVTLASLHRVVPPYSGGSSIPFTSFEGQIRWVGPPTAHVESTSSGIPLLASRLQCSPYYHDWGTVGLLHVFGSAVVPSSTYKVQMLASTCAGIEDRCTAISPPLTITTTRWGDVETPFNPPSLTVQPDVSDIGALVNKFRSAPGAPIKARALLAGAPGNPFGEITPEVLGVDFGFSHISACVDAFRGQPYPYTIQACP